MRKETFRYVHTACRDCCELQLRDDVQRLGLVGVQHSSARGHCFVSRWLNKKKKEAHSAVYNGILIQATTLECPLVEHDYGVSQQVLLQWEGKSVKGRFEFLTQEPLLHPGQAVEIQWEPELKRLFVVVGEG